MQEKDSYSNYEITVYKKKKVNSKINRCKRKKVQLDIHGCKKRKQINYKSH